MQKTTWYTSWLISNRWQVGFLVSLGLALRTVHYLRNPAMWHDEAALVMNAIEKGFHALLGPLKYAEAAPPLFLWVERAVVLGLGDGTYALRLIPYLASCLTVILMWRTASRILDSGAVVWAVMLLACSDRLLWHACEAKPYAVDAMVAMLIISLYVLSADWSMNRRILTFAGFAPFIIWISFPGCFLYGGLLLALLPELWRGGQRSPWVSYGLLVAMVLLAFLAMYLGPIRAQRNVAMDSCWVGAFPDWSRPWALPWWFLSSTVGVVDYALRPIGGALLSVVLVGGVQLWRQGQKRLLTLLVTPILLAAVAALVHSYPYTGARVMVYGLPGIAILTAAGVGPVLGWLSRPGRKPIRRGGWPACLAQVVLLILLLAPLGWSLYRIAIPWSRADTAAASAYVLARRQADDPVIANHWEYDYYFRHLGTAYQSLEHLDGLKMVHGRVWVVVSAHTVQQRRDVLGGLLLDNWKVADQRDFIDTTVVLMEQSDPRR